MSETLRVFLYALLTALATGLGALPFPFIKGFSQRLLGFGNALAAGSMLAASFNLIIELQNLALQTKQAHWNVSGTLYYPLHELLQEHYEGYTEYADRLLSIGVAADGRAETIVETAEMSVFPGGFGDAAEVLRFFIDELVLVGSRTRERITATEDPDPTTSNLLQEVEYTLAQYQRQYRAHAQSTPTDSQNGSELAQDNSAPLYGPGQ